MDGALAAVASVGTLNRHRIREVFDARFGAARMAQRYAQVYRRVIAGIGSHQRSAAIAAP